MPDNRDPVDRALQSLGGRSWPGMAHDPQLEQKLMETFATRKSMTFLARHRVLIPVVAVLALATAGLAAVEVMRWFVTVSVDGQVVHTGELTPDENGQVAIELPDGSLPAGGEHQVTLTVEGDGAGDAGGATTVTVKAGAHEATVQTSTTPAADNEK